LKNSALNWLISVIEHSYIIIFSARSQQELQVFGLLGLEPIFLLQIAPPPVASRFKGAPSGMPVVVSLLNPLLACSLLLGEASRRQASIAVEKGPHLKSPTMKSKMNWKDREDIALMTREIAAS
jgi:hypothetical protein